MKTETKLLFIASGLLAASATVGFINNNIKRRKKKNGEIFQAGLLNIFKENLELSEEFDKKYATYVDTFLELLEIEEIPKKRRIIANRLLELEGEKENFLQNLNLLIRTTYLDFSKSKKISCPNTLLEIFKKEFDECTSQYNEVLNSTEIWFEAWQEVLEEEKEERE